MKVNHHQFAFGRHIPDRCKYTLESENYLMSKWQFPFSADDTILKKDEKTKFSQQPGSLKNPVMWQIFKVSGKNGSDLSDWENAILARFSILSRTNFHKVEKGHPIHCALNKSHKISFARHSLKSMKGKKKFACH